MRRFFHERKCVTDTGLLPLSPAALFAEHVFRSYVKFPGRIPADSMGVPRFRGLADCPKRRKRGRNSRHDTAHYSGFYCAEIMLLSCVRRKKKSRIYERQRWADTAKSVINCGLLCGKEYKDDLHGLIA